jgi:hypothetical protein
VFTDEVVMQSCAVSRSSTEDNCPREVGVVMLAGMFTAIFYEIAVL